MPPSLSVARAVTRGPSHHFFGYYDKSPWDASGRYLLGLESSFAGRPPQAGEEAVVGLIDTGDGDAWTPLARTSAWNWQQGCMLQWLGDGSSGEIVFNDREGDRAVARILDVHTGGERRLGRAVYALNRTGTRAVSLSFGRLHHQRPGYGYAGVADPGLGIEAPEDDGLFSLDLATGAERLILSIAEAARFRPAPHFGGRTHRFNHVQFGTDPERFAVLHRCKTPDEEVGRTRLLTLNLDGSGLCCLTDHEMVSHYDWRGAEGIVAWSRREGIGDRYFYFQDRSAEFRAIGEGTLTCDGHCSFSPDGRWMLSDTYPDSEHYRTLFLYRWPDGPRVDLGRFYAPPMDWQIRCDLHPRWSRDGRKLCIDSLHEGSRQMYVLDVSGVVG